MDLAQNLLHQERNIVGYTYLSKLQLNKRLTGCNDSIEILWYSKQTICLFTDSENLTFPRLVLCLLKGFQMCGSWLMQVPAHY